MNRMTIFHNGVFRIALLNAGNTHVQHAEPRISLCVSIRRSAGPKIWYRKRLVPDNSRAIEEARRAIELGLDAHVPEPVWESRDEVLTETQFQDRLAEIGKGLPEYLEVQRTSHETLAVLNVRTEDGQVEERHVSAESGETFGWTRALELWEVRAQLVLLPPGLLEYCERLHAHLEREAAIAEERKQDAEREALRAKLGLE